MGGQSYRHNHYVPEWYQRRFLLPGQAQYWYLDLKPETRTSGSIRYTRRDLLPWGPKRCFAEDDLYTMRWGSIENTDVERFFFGRIDSEGRDAVELFSEFAYHKMSTRPFHALLRFMSVQKLRTPKGLGFLSQLARSQHKNLNLLLLQQLQIMHCAIWTECVWQIADASRSPVRFIISDHPVTVYNRECFPMSSQCQGFNDPDIRHVATHTYFPLSLDKVLIMTNLSWVRDPYQDAMTIRPNPELFRPAIFKFTDIQTERMLSEKEVLQINYITKKRALRYVAAAEKEWLYPERYLHTDHWRKFGNGYLFMPDPRHEHMGGEILIGYKDGRSDAFGPYGHKPWQKGYKDKEREAREWVSLERFQAEFSAMHGIEYRGIDHQFVGRGETPRRTHFVSAHEEYLQMDAEYSRRPGERQRRRRLREA
jgi:hypothetical protein